MDDLGSQRRFCGLRPQAQPEIQYLKAIISEQQRKEFGDLVTSTLAQIESGSFLPHSGIRFPNNGCTTCAHLGLCMANQSMVNAKLTRREGNDLDWLDELAAQGTANAA